MIGIVLAVLVPCHLPGLVEAADCGVLAAPLRYESPSAGSLPVHFAVLRAKGRARRPDPLFLLAGGPGQGARSYARLVARGFGGVRKTRDIVLVDLRGTGASRPLECPPAEGDARVGLAAVASTCRERLPADLSPFTTERQVRDLDLVRQQLGYARINLWGGSFGTRSALVYARLFPDRVRSVVLDGAFPIEHVFPLETARDAAAALERLFARCDQDPGCHRAYPHLRRDLDDLLEELGRAPRTATVPDPQTGRPTRIVLDRAQLVTVLKLMLFAPEHTRAIPLVIWRLKQGDMGPLLAARAAGTGWSLDTMALGLTMRLMCAEDVSRFPPGAEARTAGTFLGAVDIDGWRAMCRSFPADVPADLAVRPLAVPALILSGDRDPVTPPRWGEVMRAHFPHSAHVVVSGGAHNVSTVGCMPEVIARFVEDADPQAVAPPDCATRVVDKHIAVDAAAPEGR